MYCSLYVLYLWLVDFALNKGKHAERDEQNVLCSYSVRVCIIKLWFLPYKVFGEVINELSIVQTLLLKKMILEHGRDLF